MTEQADKVDPRQVSGADIDANGNATIWDHGPQEPKDLDHDDPHYKAAEAEAKAWHDKHGAGPVALVMHAGDARHAIDVEPERYSVDPIDLDDPEVQAEVQKIREERELAKQAAEDRAAEILYAADVKLAAARVLARRQSGAVEPAEQLPVRQRGRRKPVEGENE